MIQTQSQPLTFEANLELYPEDGGVYKLIDGEMIVVPPRGDHEEVIAFLAAELNFEIHHQKLPSLLPRICTIKPKTPYMGYKPDVVVIDRTAPPTESLWIKSSTLTQGSPTPLVIEVVSTNGQNEINVSQPSHIPQTYALA